jgi:hypothetical protein
VPKGIICLLSALSFDIAAIEAAMKSEGRRVIAANL